MKASALRRWPSNKELYPFYKPPPVLQVVLTPFDEMLVAMYATPSPPCGRKRPSQAVNGNPEALAGTAAARNQSGSGKPSSEAQP